MMRTTVTLPDDVYEKARNHAHARRISLGEALAELVRQAEPRPERRIVDDAIFPHFEALLGAPAVTLEQLLAWEAEAEEEDDLRRSGLIQVEQRD